MLTSPEFLVVWEFHVRPGSKSRFEQIYGPAGAWAQLFRRDPQFVRTELHRDLQQPGRYLTLDIWDSEAAYTSFMTRHHDEYQALDKECEGLTESEKAIGRFTSVG